MALSGKHAEVTKNRLGTFTAKDKGDINLWSKLYKTKQSATKLQVYSPPLPNHRVSFTEGIKGSFKDTKIGESFGPSWSTHWFDITFDVPKDWVNEEIHFIWDSECEALLWSPDGTPLQAFLGSAGEDRRSEYTLNCKSGESLHLYVEMACTAMFGNGTGNGWGGLGPTPTDMDKKFQLKQVHIATFDRLAYDLLIEFTLIKDMAEHLPAESVRASQALTTANKIMNVFQLESRDTWEKCREIAKKFLGKRNGDSQHSVSAVGHCHIDTAWLWPYAETMRKCARSWSTQLRICERHPKYVFGCSQAQQFEWVKELYPKLYSQVKDFVKKGQFVPIGGTWVEMDCNIPSGESLVRQFLIGQRFFEKEFNMRCKEFWLPDTFGYAAQLPQIIKGVGIEYFLTQKLSWCQFNKFPHHTFLWEGLDGTRVFTHFPPTDTYNAQTTVKEALFHVKNYKEKERSNESMMVFGHGDGGGGPLMSMVDTLARFGDIEGLPKIEMRTPNEFFERCKNEMEDIAVWVGELYFEYHRGTYTTQAKNKLYNRKCENLLRNVELWGVLGTHLKGFEYPSQDLEKLWKLVLLNQFHDVIPGSSINEVYKDSTEHYLHVLELGGKLLENSLQAFASEANKKTTIFNSLSWTRKEVVEINNNKYIVSVPSMGYASLENATVKCEESVCVSDQDGTVVMENQYVKVVFNKEGYLVSLYDKKAEREAIEPGKNANQYVMYEDIPMYWDAWDVDVFHLEKRTNVTGGSIKVVEKGPLRVSVEISTPISSTSKMTQTVSLSAISPRLDFSCEVDWDESHKFLKVEFPLNIRTMAATYEIQYGHLQRPTHWNTSWEVAKFEVCAQKWADVSESGFGVALLNDCKYGHATHGNVLRLSLLRSAKNPDPEADIGHHSIRYALFPHSGTFQEANVVQEAYAFNIPLQIKEAATKEDVASFFKVSKNSVIIDTVKKAKDSNAVIVRMYECHGGRTSFKLESSLPVKSAHLVNLMEEQDQAISWADGSVQLYATPFQIITVKLVL